MDCRKRLLLFGLQRKARGRRSGPRFHTKCSVVVVTAYFGGCTSGEDHVLHLSGGGSMSTSASAVRFESVSKAFASNVVLDNVSFQIDHGEAFCLLGRSGTGK